MRTTRRTLAAVLAGGLAAAAALGGTAACAQDEPIRVAMGDIASVESLGLLIAMERTKERGMPMELTFFNEEDVAAQAVVGGEADIGVGAPYAFIQNSDAPIRMFFRMSTLLFFPVVNTEVYKGWEDLDGQEVTVQSRGSGTEALMRLMEQQHGIKYSNMSYVPGAEVRAGAMLQGTINASDRRRGERSGCCRSRAAASSQRLPIEGVNATDEALYANVGLPRERARPTCRSSSRSCCAPGPRSTRIRRSWRSCASSTACSPTCRTRRAAEAVALLRRGGGGRRLPADGGEPQDVARRHRVPGRGRAGRGRSGGEVDAPQYWDFDRARGGEEPANWAADGARLHGPIEPSRLSRRRQRYPCRPGPGPRGAARRDAGCSGSCSRSRSSRGVGDRRADRASTSPSRPSSSTAAAFWEMIADGSMGAAYLRTIEPLAIGLAISLVVGRRAPAWRWGCAPTSNGCRCRSSS